MVTSKGLQYNNSGFLLKQLQIQAQFRKEFLKKCKDNSREKNQNKTKKKKKKKKERKKLKTLFPNAIILNLAQLPANLQKLNIKILITINLYLIHQV